MHIIQLIILCTNLMYIKQLGFKNSFHIFSQFQPQLYFNLHIQFLTKSDTFF